MTEPQFISDRAYIAALATTRGVAYEFYTHAEREMARDKISRIDVRNVLSNCDSVVEENHGYCVRYAVTGKDTDLRTITVVIEIEEETITIVVVTAWKK